jgi:hypothetical protein
MARRATAHIIPLLLFGLLLSSCNRWNVPRSDGNRCEIGTGMSQDEVRATCGAAIGFGIRPAVPKRLPEGGWTLCAGDCERYGEMAVVYNCDRRVARVTAISGAGCQGL